MPAIISERAGIVSPCLVELPLYSGRSFNRRPTLWYPALATLPLFSICVIARTISTQDPLKMFAESLMRTDGPRQPSHVTLKTI